MGWMMARLGFRWWAVLLLAAAGMSAQGAEQAKQFVEQMRAGKLACALDALVSVPGAWAVTPEDLDKSFAVPAGVKVEKNPYFDWLTQSKERAHFIKRPFTNLAIELTILEGSLPVEEAIIDFRKGKLNGVTLSLYNRGDSSAITGEEFERRFKGAGRHLGEQLGTRPRRREADPGQGLLVEGWLWSSEKGYAMLEYNPEAMKGGQAEFLRLRLAPRDGQGAMFALMSGKHSAVSISQLPKNVEKSAEGDVWIGGVPMVNQGPKGYCVVASCQRLFEYYGIPCDQHQLAQVAGSDASRGTSSLAIAEALGKIDYRFNTRFSIIGLLTTKGRLHEVDGRDMVVGKPLPATDFEKKIKTFIDRGIPLLWSLELGRFPEEPAINLQEGGNHMRLIVGYNEKTGKLIFSDSWGAGHEQKRMTLRDAYQATHGLFVMLPTT